MSNESGSATTGMRVSRGAAEEDEDHQDDEDERDHQRHLHVVDRIHDALRAIEGRDEVDRSGQLEAQLRQQAR